MKKKKVKIAIKKWHILSLIGFISILTIIVGYKLYKNEENNIRKEKHDFIKGIALLKINQLSDWFNDEMNDARYINDNYIEAFYKQNSITVQLHRLQIYKFINDIKKQHDYKDIIILSKKGNVLFSTDKKITEFDSITNYYVNNVIESHEIKSTDIYFCKLHKEVQIDFIAPVIKDNKEVEQVIIFRIDPNKFLFPLITYWPTPSKTAETLLLRRERDSVLFLNELRHKKNTALKLRISLKKTDIPAVRAALGYEGVFEGIDYRGEKVLAFTAKVVNTPWYMVSKIDKYEIYEELYFRAGIIIAFIIIAIALCSILLFGYYNILQKNIYRKLWESEQEFKTTLQSIGDAVITTDINSNVKYLNPVAEKLTGWKNSDAFNRNLEEIFRIINEDTRENVVNPVEKVLKEGLIVGLANHTLLISKNGIEIPIADSGSPIKNEDGEIIGVVLVFRDQSKERFAEKEINRLNRLYKTLSETNECIVRIKEKDKLLEEVCRVAVNHGNFILSWIGLFDEVKNRIIPFKWFGKEDGFLTKEYLEAEKDKLNLMPCSKAFIQNRIQIVGDVSSDPECEFWKDSAIKRGFYSLAATPIKLHSKNIGVYVLYASEKNFFGEKEVSLIEEAASDISFALETMQNDESKKIIEQKLIQSEETYRNLFQNAQVGLYRTRISDGKLLESNDQLAKMFGYENREEFIAEYVTSQNYVDHGRREQMLDLLTSNGFIQNYEARFYKKDRSIFWVRYSAKIYPDKGWIEGVAEDVTELKKAEAALIESELKFRRLAENAQDLIYRYEFYPVRGFTYVSPSATTITGYTPEEHYADPDLGFKLVHPEDRHLLQSLTAGEELIKKPVTLRWIRKDEKIIWTEQKNIPIYNEKGELTAIEGIARDVTKIKLAELELIKSEERFRSIFENALVGIYRTTPDGKILLANPALIKMLGYESFEQLAERNLNDLDYEPEYKRNDFINILSENKIIESFDSIWNKKDGSKIFVRESVRLIKDKDNNPLYFEGIVQDITEKKLAEEKLTESEQKYRHISELVSDYAYSFKVEEGNRLTREWVTDSFTRITGYTINEVDDRGGWVSLIHPDDMQIALRRASLLFQGFEDVSEFRIVTKDGTIKWLRDYGKPIWDNNLNRVVKILGAAKDITENKKAEELLVNERLLLRTVIENLPVAIYVKDKNLRKTLTNKTDLSNLGAENELQVIGKTDYDFYSKEVADKFTDDDKEIIHNGKKILNKEESFVDKNGKIKWLLTSKLPLRNALGEIEGLLGIGIDITDRKMIQEELIRAKEKAEESDKLKTEFLAQMSHEIRTPIHIITSSIELIKDDLLGDISDEDIELFENIAISAKRIMRTINLILNVSEVQLGIYQPFFKILEIENDILTKVVTEYKKLAKDKNLDLILKCNSKNSLIKGDEYSITQIFANLIDNAIKYTREGRVEVLTFDDDQDNLIVEVKDTGIGMSIEFMEKMFEPFTQEEHGLARTYEGNGLGLSLVSKYCILNNAKIELESVKNVGSTFRVLFKKSDNN